MTAPRELIKSQQRNGLRGLALVAVLWMVAALSIMVVGMSAVVRAETRAVSMSRQSIQLGAQGVAAINLVLQDMVAAAPRINRLTTREVSYAGQDIRVEILPLNGLIDINNASEALLAKLISIQGGVEYQQGLRLARSSIEKRSLKDRTGKARGFEALEDWLSVEGMDYELYARVRDLATADLYAVGTGRVNPLAAPREVLNVLAGGNDTLVARIASERDTGTPGIDTTALEAADVESGIADRFRLTASVQVPGSPDLLLRVVQSVDLAPAKRDGLPWRIFDTDRRFHNLRADRSL